MSNKKEVARETRITRKQMDALDTLRKEFRASNSESPYDFFCETAGIHKEWSELFKYKIAQKNKDLKDE